MRSTYENTILRPAVLQVLTRYPELVVHAAPVELLTAAPPCRSCGSRPLNRTRPAYELGAGTPDLLLSVRWRARYEQRTGTTDVPGVGPLPSTETREIFGAAWLCLELKAPTCPGSAAEVLICGTCLEPPPAGLEVASARCGCGGRRRSVMRWSRGTVSSDQQEMHAAWDRAGRWVTVVRTPAEACASVDEARRRLRLAGLEPVPVAGREIAAFETQVKERLAARRRGDP